MSRVTIALTALIIACMSCKSNKVAQSSANFVETQSVSDSVSVRSELISLFSARADSVTVVVTADSVRTPKGAVVYSPKVVKQLASPSVEVASASSSERNQASSADFFRNFSEDSEVETSQPASPLRILLALVVFALLTLGAIALSKLLDKFK